MNSWDAIVARFLPVVAGIALAGLLLFLILRGASGLDWPVLAKGAGAIALSLIAIFALRLALGSGNMAVAASGGTVAVSEEPTRARIAPLIIGIGTLGIGVVSLAVIVFVSVWADDSIRAKLDTILLSVFASTLPVFATWVGTVIAFYFSNESFRQASESARGIMQSPEPEAITDPKRMIAYEKITKIELTDALAGTKPDDLAMAEVRKRFTDTISRVIIFDKERRPIYVIRKKLDTNTQASTVADYLASARNRLDATNFRFLPVHANVEDGRRTLRLYNTADIFVTDGGTSEEPTKGWVADDRLA